VAGERGIAYHAVPRSSRVLTLNRNFNTSGVPGSLRQSVQILYQDGLGQRGPCPGRDRPKRLPGPAGQDGLLRGLAGGSPMPLPTLGAWKAQFRHRNLKPLTWS